MCRTKTEREPVLRQLRVSPLNCCNRVIVNETHRNLEHDISCPICYFNYLWIRLYGYWAFQNCLQFLKSRLDKKHLRRGITGRPYFKNPRIRILFNTRFSNENDDDKSRHLILPLDWSPILIEICFSSLFGNHCILPYLVFYCSMSTESKILTILILT